jgi:hypothetical protein
LIKFTLILFMLFIFIQKKKKKKFLIFGTRLGLN